MLQLSLRARNIRLDVFETTVGESPILEIRTGLPPANCAAPDEGLLLARITLPADWLAPAADGRKEKSGSWEVLFAQGTGLASHFRIKSAGGLCDLQGSCSAEGDGGDIELDNPNVVAGRRLSVVSFTLVDNNP